VSGIVPGVVCRALEAPLPGSSWRTWYSWAKLAQLIDELPF
jgi:hypothetical protein